MDVIVHTRVDGGDPAGYAGSDPSFVAFDYALKTRRAWTTFSSWRNKGKPAGATVTWWPFESEICRLSGGKFP